MTQWTALVLVAAAYGAQEDFDYKAYTEAPRLLANGRRLRLLKRERERQSLRWQQFSTLIEGHAAMPEPGFASALYGAVMDSAVHCKAAAGGVGGDLRQAALVYDWCSKSLEGAQASALAVKLKAALAGKTSGVVDARNRAFAALALAGVEAQASEKALREVVEGWWKPVAAPALKARRNIFSTPEQVYALMELLHAIRDNLKLELREDAPAYFDELSAVEMLGTYPAPWPAAENDYRIPVYDGSGEPDLRQAALDRAASLALVALDGNAQPQQFLQGWLINDRYLMRSPFGIVYEFLWANPYQPGLSYYYMPDVYHANGRLLVRSTWDDNAVWFCYAQGKAQYFKDGQRAAVNLKGGTRQVSVGDTRILFAPARLKFVAGDAPLDEEAKLPDQLVFVLNLTPKARYDLEVDGEEMTEVQADEGGILELKFARGRPAGVRLKPAGSPPVAQ